jgi:opacity protein-like surface antigen
MKKLALIACLSTTLLVPMTVQAQWDTTWLVGIEGGFSTHEPHLNHDFSLAPLGRSYSNDLDSDSWIWGVFGGYQANCNQWLLALELNFDWQQDATRNFAYGDTNVLTGFAAGGSANYNRGTTIGLTGRFGYELVCWFTPYIRLGVETSRDRFEIDLRQYEGTATYHADNSDRSYRFIGGLGFEMPIAQCTGLTVRAEYDYISKNEAHDLNGSWSDPRFASHFNLDNDHTNVFKVAFAYNFNF